ncbi:MAG: FixH family protein [Magnetococcales bacterium]|nr:FixH family protein [Magnetococcales bacterium]
MASLSTSNVNQDRRFEPWPWAIVAFFVVVFLANAVFVYLSQATWNGLVTDKHYEKGLAFNQVLDAQRRQDALGWQARWIPEPLNAGQPSTLLYRLNDLDGTPISGAEVSVLFFRPVKEGDDFTVTLREERPGHYTGEATPPLPGVWDLSITTQRGEDKHVIVRRVRVAASGKK